MGKEETIIQKQILDYLRVTTIRGIKIPVTRHNVYKPMFVKKYKTPDPELGWADIIAILPPFGQVLCIEVKRPKGELRIKQLERQADILQAGGQYIFADNLNQVKEYIENYEKSEHFISTINRIHNNFV